MGAKFVLLELLLALYCCRYVESSSKQFSQNTVELLPCDKRPSKVSLSNSTLFTVMANLTNCPKVNRMNHHIDIIGFRISTFIAADLEGFDGGIDSLKPVVFTARQLSNDRFLSWDAPLNYSSVLFRNVSHTMCTVKNFTDDNMPLFYIDAFTSSHDNVTFTIEVELVQNFVLKINETYPVDVGRATPQIYYYKIPSNIKLVTVEASSDVYGCTIVSVQNNTCPVNDLFENSRSKGIYQTMTTSAFLTINADSIPNREFLLVLVTADYSLCYSNTTNNPERTINVKIGHMNPTNDYVWAMMLPVVICAVIYCLAIVVYCCYACRWEPCCIPLQFKNCCYHQGSGTENSSMSCCCRPCVPIGPSRCIVRGTDSVPEPQSSLQTTGTIEEDPYCSSTKNPLGCICCTRFQRVKPEICVSAPDPERAPLLTRSTSININPEQTSTAGDGKPYHVYSWNTVTVGIFYALPALQLVFSEQNILDQSGNQDTCYYNFKCAHPAGPFTAFNNIWSNIGYLLLGFLFICIVFFRHCQYMIRRIKNNDYVDSHGVPQFFGIYYAMGIALILEGFMSSLYHICPSNANFQFDTAFMFITGGIILVKVYQNRHPSVQANAFVAFFAFAVIILFTVIGIYKDRHHPLSVKLSFFFLALLVIFLFLTHFYSWNYGLQDLQKVLTKFRDGCKLNGVCTFLFAVFLLTLDWLFSLERWKNFWKDHKYRIGKHVLIFCCNILLGIGVCALYKDVGIATAILVFFVVNIIVYLVIYCVIKICYGEPWTWLAPVLLVLIGVFWLVAFHFYGTVTDWSDTPAGSRAENRECYLEGFYDYHDVWHFFSACGMFFAFLFVLVIDDGVVDMDRNTLLERAV